MTDVLKETDRAAWRQIEFPISSREYGFQQEQATHRFIFIDNELIESLGRSNPTWRYTIPFREDITAGGWSHLFVDVYPEFLSACQDRSRGVLDDPFHGAKPAKCVSVRETVDVNKRDGVDVEVEFIFAPDENDFSSKNEFGVVIRNLQGAKDFALRFDTEVATVDFKQAQPPKPTINPLDLPALFGDQLKVASDKVTAAFGDAALRAERSGDALEKLRDPSLASQIQSARRLEEALKGLLIRNQTKSRPISRITTTSNHTVSALASICKMTPKELMDLNPDLARPENFPVIPASTVVWVFSDALNGKRP